jgi:predicted acylesterase/phospholipase RssA
MSKIPSIHFFLPGGGVKGCFQAGFLYRLFSKYPTEFTNYQIDGCSVGSLNGFAIATGNIENLKKTWTNIKSTSDIFSHWSHVPLVNRIVTLYNTYHYKGVYSNAKLKEIIMDNTITEGAEIEKFHCVVTNVRTGVYQYINGRNPEIRKYVIASASPWIVCPPEEINSNLYTDGGLLQVYPIEYLEDSEADIKIIVGFDESHLLKHGLEGNNVFTYLGRIIDICRNNSINIWKIKNLIKEDKIINIINPVQVDFINFNPDVIDKGFKYGEIAADKFALKYLSSPKKINNNFNRKKMKKSSSAPNLIKII